MNKRELSPGVVVYDNIIDGYETLVSDIEEGMISANRQWQQSTVKRGDDTGVYTDSRDTLTTGIPYNDTLVDNFTNLNEAFNSTLSNIFLSGFGPAEEDYKAEYQIPTTWHDQYGILKYGVGQKFINHIDDHKDFHRRISTVYYINDNYSGGEIFFPRFNFKYKPKANELLIFPSTYVYNHSVLPVTEGTRYAVVSWLR
jgi:hypothetical protein